MKNFHQHQGLFEKIFDFQSQKYLTPEKYLENLLRCKIKLQGVPKKMVIRKGFKFLTLGGVFLGVKNNSKNFRNKKNIGLFSKILSKWTLFHSKSSDLFNLYDFVHFKMSKNHSKSFNICYLYTCMHKY